MDKVFVFLLKGDKVGNKIAIPKNKINEVKDIKNLKGETLTVKVNGIEVEGDFNKILRTIWPEYNNGITSKSNIIEIGSR